MRSVLIVLFSLGTILAKSESTSILDLVVIGKDTIIASTHDMRIIVSRDGGKSWVTTEDILIKKLGLDGKRIWGIDSWIGIHERSYSRLFYSDDIGKTWKQIELNPESFFATDFLEIAGKLWIVDAHGDLWEHKITNVETSLSWKKRTSINCEFRKGYHNSVCGNKYLLASWDSLYETNVKSKTIVRSRIPFDIFKLAGYLNDKEVFFLTQKDSLYVYSIQNKKSVLLQVLKGFWSYTSSLKFKDDVYILGRGDYSQDRKTRLLKIKPDYSITEVSGLSGEDEDFSFVDRNNRIWFGTTNGIFVLDSTTEKIKKIL